MASDPLACVARAREVPGWLQELRAAPRGDERAVEVVDELLAELDVLLWRCAAATAAGEPLGPLGSQVIALKGLVYRALHGFLAERGWPSGALRAHVRAAHADLVDSARRLAAARPDGVARRGAA